MRALHREHFRTFRQLDDLNLIPRLKESEAHHMMTVAPEIEGGVGLIAELTKQGWIVSIGRAPASARTSA
jgi:N-acetylglucosamine-6-phosphate deacetylase